MQGNGVGIFLFSFEKSHGKFWTLIMKNAQIPYK